MDRLKFLPNVKAFKPLDFGVEDFRSRAFFSLTLAVVLILAPFAVIHWVSARYDMALGALLVMSILAVNFYMHGRGQ